VDLQHVWEKYREKDVVVLGFDSVDEPAFAADLLKEKGITFPNVLDTSADAKRVTSEISAYPTNYLIGRDGKIVASFAGYGGSRRVIDAIEKALAAETK